ncbi:MAG: DUF1329 domain-containing protein [Porticoccaceae bacterium]
MKAVFFLKYLLASAAVGIAAMVYPALAEMTDAELAEIGIENTKYTPVGALRAGNAEGTIPAWSSTPIPVPAGRVEGTWPDPFADEKPLFTITADNYTQHQDKLTAGQIGMFKQYPETFRMHIYPTHRTAVADKWVYEATLKQAKGIKLCPETASDGIVCLADQIPGGGVPFPRPKNAFEAGWNHFLGWQGLGQHSTANGALIDSLGNRTDVILESRLLWPWWAKPGEMGDSDWYSRDGGAMLCDSWQIQQPPRSSGLVFGGCNYAENVDFQVSLYVPGQRRVRKAPEIGFHDSPSFGSDGQRTVTSRWMWWFGGREVRHDYTISSEPVEKYVPYNNYKLAQEDVSSDDIFGKKHINQDLVRYELHRVWIMDSILKPGMRHLYKRHTAYFDEDSWVGVGFEAYDAKDRLWRVGEQFNIQYYGANVFNAYGDSQIDLINGRYTTFPYWFTQVKNEHVGFGIKMFSEMKNLPYNVEIFTPQGLRKFGQR